MLMIKTLKEEWDRSSNVVNKLAEKASEMYATYEGNSIYLRSLERKIKHLKGAVMKVTQLREDLKKAKATELVLVDKHRILEWQCAVMKASLFEALQKRDKMQAVLRDLLIQISQKRKSVSSRLLETLDKMAPKPST